MRLCRTLILILTLTACGTPAPTATPNLPAPFVCGDGICEGGENNASCPQDCPEQTFSGRVEITYIDSSDENDDENSIRIAVMVASPVQARYENGAGVVVVVSPFFTDASGFVTDPDLTSLGLIQVSYLWPGKTDESTGARSTGEFDYGGEQSLRALRDVIRFAAGRIPDRGRHYIGSLTDVPPLTDEVGLYAFSHAGMAAVNVLARYGGQLPGVEYLVGRENPTVDSLACLEIGYRDDDGQPVHNPFYSFPASYSPGGLAVNYSNLRWDPAYNNPHTNFTGHPYLDLDGNGAVSPADHVFGWRVPVMFGKRYYSTALTQALLDNGALTLLGWPVDLATPEEAAEAWRIRLSPNRYMSLSAEKPNLKVMLIFAVDDHLQVAQDKPHIHQAFQGFRFDAGLWVRLNPDRSYVQALLPGSGLDFPDTPANTQPLDWLQIDTYAYPNLGEANRLVPLAAVAEMADRAHAGRWDENFGRVLYPYTAPTPQP